MLAYLDTAIGFVVVMLVISLLITILTQMVSALINHRGSNLQWGLKTLFANIDPTAYPQLTAQADAISRQVLTHCLISDSWFSGNRVAQWFAARIPLLDKLFKRFQLASAIRPSELAHILAHIASTLPALPVPRPVGFVPTLRSDIEDLLLADNPTAARDIRLVATAVANAGAVPAAVPPLNPVPLFEDAVNTVRASAGRLEAWFGSVMDRVAQKFAMYMRLWTVGFACLFAFVSGLNTLNLVAEIYRNGVLRDALIGASQQVTTAAATVLDPQNTPAARYTAALKDAVKSLAPPVAPPSITTTAEGDSWINANVPAGQQTAIQNAFDTAASNADKNAAAANRETAQKLIAITNKAGIQVLAFHWPPGFWQETWRSEMRYLLGVFLTAGMLSLGAPFWFNALKSLANLRPILASKQQAEQQQSHA